MGRDSRDQLTYVEVGATSGPLPEGYHHVEHERVIGHGPECFASAASRLFAWDVQRSAGVRVRAAGPVRLGSIVDLRLGVPPMALRARCRVVSLVDVASRAAFAYGTLAGHPEQGEERFEVELLPDQRVVLRIRAFSRPARWYSRLAAPISRHVQRRITDRYLHSLDC